MNLMFELNRRQLKNGLPSFRPGDTVCVYSKVKEGEKERIQAFKGTVIARKGSAITETFTVRKVSYGIGVERIFQLHSPVIDRIEVEQHGSVSRAKLYYLRELSGRAARIEERQTNLGGENEEVAAESAEAPSATAEA